MSLLGKKTSGFDWLNAIVPPIAWGVLIFILSSQQQLPSFEVSTVDFVFKKMAHMFVYGVFYFLVLRCLRLTTSPKLATHHWWITLAICLGYALSDELHQSFVLNRHSSPVDIGYDLLGSSIVMLRLYRYI